MLDNIYLKFINSLLIHIYRKNVKNTDLHQEVFLEFKELSRKQICNFIKIINKVFKKIDKNEIRIGDIGCGFVILIHSYQRIFTKSFYKGYDINSDFVNYCKTLNKAHKDFFCLRLSFRNL